MSIRASAPCSACLWSTSAWGIGASAWPRGSSPWATWRLGSSPWAASPWDCSAWAGSPWACCWPWAGCPWAASPLGPVRWDWPPLGGGAIGLLSVGGGSFGAYAVGGGAVGTQIAIGGSASAPGHREPGRLRRSHLRPWGRPRRGDSRHPPGRRCSPCMAPGPAHLPRPGSLTLVFPRRPWYHGLKSTGLGSPSPGTGAAYDTDLRADGGLAGGDRRGIPPTPF